MPSEAARAIWEVTAGLLPGQAEPEHTRRYAVTVAEWEQADAERDVLLLARFLEAVAYAAVLQAVCSQGRAVNWVRVDFVWP